MIVFEPSPIGIGRMELYDMRDGRGLLGSITARPAGLKKMDKRVIRLSDCLSITPAPGESCPTDCSAFFLNTITCTYTIATPTREDWMSVLCQLAFQVGLILHCRFDENVVQAFIPRSKPDLNLTLFFL